MPGRREVELIQYETECCSSGSLRSPYATTSHYLDNSEYTKHHKLISLELCH